MTGKTLYDELGETWYYGNTLSAVIGQAENNFTPLQMARYIAMLTNGGKQVDITIMKDIVNNNGESINKEEVEKYINNKLGIERTNREDLNIHQENLETVLEGMQSVTEEGGTAYSIFRDFDIQIGGKTGSAEAGDKTNGTTLRSKVTTDHEVVVQKGVAPYNYIPWGVNIQNVDAAFIPTEYNDDNARTHGAAYLAKNLYTGKEQAQSVTSTLCYSSQWDAMCRYIGDSNRNTPTKSAPELTGSVATDVSKNIYDLAGNCYEWTFEVYNIIGNNRINRGGSYDESSPAFENSILKSFGRFLSAKMPPRNEPPGSFFDCHGQPVLSVCF